MKPRHPPVAVSPRRVGEAVGVSTLTVRRWIKRGYLRATRVGPHLVRVPRSEIIRILSVRAAFVDNDDPQYPVVAPPGGPFPRKR